MNPAIQKAIIMMFVALPTMVIVISLFILATKLLHKAFPATAEAQDHDDEEDEE